VGWLVDGRHIECHGSREASSGSFITRAMALDPGISFLPTCSLSSLATSAIVMEHGDSSRGSWVDAPRERGGTSSRHRRLIPDAISMSGYGQAQYAACCGVPTPLQEVQEELATIKAVVSLLEEEAALAHSQRTKFDHRCASEWPSISSLGSLVGVLPYSWLHL
jgi:hypothetical protein